MLISSSISSRYLHCFPLEKEFWRAISIGYGRIRRKVSERRSDLDIILLTEWNPKGSKIGGFDERIEDKGRTTIVGDIASQLVSRIVDRHQRQHRVYRENRRFQDGIRRCHKHVNCWKFFGIPTILKIIKP